MPGILDTTRDFSRFAFRMGSARTRSATQSTATVPGPRPFAPGSFSRGAAVTKGVHALLAALVNGEVARARETAAREKLALDEKERGLRITKLERDLAPPDLGAIEAEERAKTKGHELGQVDVHGKTAGKLKAPVPPDVLKYWPGAPAEMSLDEIDKAREIYVPKPKKRTFSIPGVPYEVEEGSSLANEYFGRRAGISGSTSFDPSNEAEIAAERGAQDVYDRAVAAAKSRFALAGRPDLLLSGALPPEVLNDPEVVKASGSLQSTRGRNIALSIGRAKDVGSMITALSRFYSGDPLYKNEAVLKMRRQAILNAAKMAQGSEIDRLIRLTEDPSDPINQDPEIRTALGLY